MSHATFSNGRDVSIEIIGALGVVGGALRL